MDLWFLLVDWLKRKAQFIIRGPESLETIHPFWLYYLGIKAYDEEKRNDNSGKTTHYDGFLIFERTTYEYQKKWIWFQEKISAMCGKQVVDICDKVELKDLNKRGLERLFPRIFIWSYCDSEMKRMKDIKSLFLIKII